MKRLQSLTIFIFPPILAALVAGCTGLPASEGYSGFDQARTVKIDPHGTDGGGWPEIMIGGQWTAASPGQAVLVIELYGAYVDLTGVEFNIDGQKVALQPTASVTGMNLDIAKIKTSTRGFVAPLSTVEGIVHSKRTWVRVITATGTLEAPVIQGGKKSLAFHALTRFVKAIQAGNSPKQG